jgi:5-amino-6-(5-phosphoribosylamino)uracil reductase
MTALRLLLPADAVVGDLEGARDATVQALADLYAYPDPVPPGGWVRANMISTLDGSATGPDSLSGSIGGPADRAVFSAVRGVADVILAGAGTARAEGYRRPQAMAEFAERRARDGQPPAPSLALITRTGTLPAGAVGPGSGYVVTSEDADLAALTAQVGADRVIVAGRTEVDLAAAVAALAHRGMPRILLEGGPRVLGQALAQGVVDELCLSLSPILVGGSGPRIAWGPPANARLRAAHLLIADDMLIGRWFVVRPAAV